jgi:hypothetical protein
MSSDLNFRSQVKAPRWTIQFFESALFSLHRNWLCDSLAHLKTSFLNFIPDLCILTWIPPIQKVMTIIFFWHYVILAFLGRSQLEGHHCNRFSFWQIIIVESCVVNNIFLSTFAKEQKSVQHYSLFLLNKWIIYINVALLFTLRCSLL